MGGTIIQFGASTTAIRTAQFRDSHYLCGLEQDRGAPLEHLPAALESREHVGQFGDRVPGAAGIEHHEVGGIADDDAVISGLSSPKNSQRSHPG